MKKTKGNIKSIVKSIVRLHPKGEYYARLLIFNMWRLKNLLVYHSKKIDVSRTYWISPQKIEYAVKGVNYQKANYSKYGDRGTVQRGDWDLKRIKFSELPIYKAFVDHFAEKKDWEHTEFYRLILKEIQNGVAPWGCNTKSDVDKRFAQIGLLYEAIKRDGFKCQAELIRGHCPDGTPFQSEDEITLRIDRNGGILCEDGRHRLAIAKLFYMTEIPVKISVRHSRWYRFRKEILNYAKENKNRVYQRITHIDLSDIPSAHGDGRFKVMKPYLPVSKGDLLDIGAHWGYFSHKCEELGFNCHALEFDHVNLYFLRKLKKAENRKFEIIDKSVLDYRDKKYFSVVLALNIFHHLIKHEDSYYRLTEFLQNLNMNLMFFEPHLPDDPQMTGAFKNYNCDEFVEFVLKHTRLNHSKLIGEAEFNRPIYLLSE